MVLSRRERVILLATALAVSAFALDQLVVSPLLAEWSKSQATRAKLQAELDRTKSLLTQRDQLTPRWRQMVLSGIKTDPGEAESLIQRSVLKWTTENAISQISWKPERLTDKNCMQQIAFQVVGTGYMQSVAKLIWQIQTAEMPLKIKEFQIEGKENSDILSVTLALSTVYLPADAKWAAVPGAALSQPVNNTPSSQPVVTSARPGGDNLRQSGGGRSSGRRN